MAFLSVFVGILTGVGAVVIKKSVHFIHSNIHRFEAGNWWYIFMPLIGIGIALLFMKYIIKRPVRHGVPNVLYAKGKAKGFMRAHNMYSSIVTSALTVGFGGSVGLEGPTVSTGAAIGSNVGRFLHLRLREVILLLGCASAGAMAAIFKAPITAIVFALEVIMLDLTMASIIPLLLASVSAVLVSYSLTGQDVLYPFTVEDGFVLKDISYYILLGVVTGFVSVYFKRIYVFITSIFENMKTKIKRLIVGGLVLGGILVIFPSLYGEGYEVINSCLKGNLEYLFTDTIYSSFKGNLYLTVAVLVAVGLTKVIATTISFGAGGVGGIFAPTLFVGVHIGLAFALLANQLGPHTININNFALMGMAGMISAVLHAPLTSIFLIAELSGGYQLFVPLMITSTLSFFIVRLFEKHSVYTYQLASRKELITHHKDQAILSMMEVHKLIETDFATISPDATLGDLVHVIENAHRNLFPVVDDEGKLHGMVKMDDVRKIIFKPELYDKVKVSELMYMPEHFISPDDRMEDLVDKFSSSARYNICVIDNGKYLGFISRAKAFTAYRYQMKRHSQE
ncbi:chloride channel protein [Saccharicrinis sp. FJH62]|uniref:chloride channel protein n=1 Tax=Saccharicrinis sp. FJH62 TaxID=3344657 RepID=UPI0035D3DAC8